MKEKVIIWGAGGTARDFLNKRGFYRNFEIIAFTDNSPKTWHKEFCGFKVIEPLELLNMVYDFVIICSLYEKEIQKQLEEQLSIEPKKIIMSSAIEEIVKNKVLEKYIFAQGEIKEIIDYFKTNKLNVYGNFRPSEQPYLVYRDFDFHPYIMLDSKRMYFPDNYNFMEADGKELVGDILYEQKDGSPHQYVRKNDEINEGSIIVDAGVCEGNFALRYIEKAKKMYLIESDHEWMNALQRTFRPYRKKVVFCQKFLTRYDSVNTITLDSLISESIDFIKMDIEGAEIDALLGAQKTLRRSNARCAICSYHKQNDEENIRFLLESYGYKTSTSKGYMFFSYDENIVDTLDLRKGVVYGDKSKKTNMHIRDI